MPGLFFSVPSSWWALNSNFYFPSARILLKDVLSFPFPQQFFFLNWQMSRWCKQQQILGSFLWASLYSGILTYMADLLKKKMAESFHLQLLRCILLLLLIKVVSISPSLEPWISYSLLQPVEDNRSISGARLQGSCMLQFCLRPLSWELPWEQTQATLLEYARLHEA